MIVRIFMVEAAMRAPWVSSGGAITRRRVLVLALRDADGRTGFGEAAPLPSYDGVELSHVREALEDCRELLAAADGSEREQLLAACAHAAVLPQAVAAVDLALWDLAGRRAGLPVWRLLTGAGGAGAGEAATATGAVGPGSAERAGGDQPDPIVVNATIAAGDRSSAASAAAAARAEGYRTIKVKVGIGDDHGRLAAIRAAVGEEMAIRLDANGAWSVAEARASIRTLAPVGIELCEEPVSGIHELEEVSADSAIPIALDESSIAPGALERRVADAVCLKISRWGGITGVLAAARRARATGYGVYLASTLDGPLGIAAALHTAVALRPDRVCGLATLDEFADRPNPLPARDGAIAIPPGPGLGDGLSYWYSLR